MQNAFTVENRQAAIVSQIIAVRTTFILSFYYHFFHVIKKLINQDFGCLTVVGAKVLGNCSSTASSRSLLVEEQSFSGHNSLAVDDRSLNLTTLINTLVKTFGCPVVNLAYNLCVTLDPANAVTTLIETVGCAAISVTSAVTNCPTSRTIELANVNTDVADVRSLNIIQTYGCPTFSFAQKVCAILDPTSKNNVTKVLANVGCYGVQAALSLEQCSSNSTSSQPNGALIKTYGCPSFQIASKICQQYNSTSSG